MAINDILEIGAQALAANRTALQTTSNNIANTNTPGYSRQRPVFTSHEQSLVSGNRLGGGVEVKQVVRSHDVFVQHQLIDESKTLGSAKMRAQGLQRLEGIVSNDGFQVGDLINKFFSDVRELSANPETPALRTAVAVSAENTSAGFRKINDSLQAMKADIDSQLTFGIEEVNSMTKELAGLNQRIYQYEAGGESPNELYDRRDQIQRDLSARLGFDVSTDDHGHVNISAGGLGIIVQGGEAHELVTQRTPEAGAKGAGSVDIFVKEPAGVRNVTKAFKDGELGGLLHVRDQVVNPALAQLDRAAFELTRSVNETHREGQGLDGLSDRGLFKDLDVVKDASHNIDLSDAVKKSHDSIAVGLDATAAGDNRVALRIGELQTQKLLPLASAGPLAEGEAEVPSQTLNDSLNSMVGRIAVESAAEEQGYRHQEAIMGQLENYRQSITGVSLEEEAMNMMQFQAVFNASAKAMKVGDELFDTILSLKR